MNKQEQEILNSVINSNFIFSLAVVKDNLPHVCTAFYVTTDNRTLYFKSRTASDHSVALNENPIAAISIYTPDSTYTEKSGIQCLGKVSRVIDLAEMATVVGLYAKKFVGSKQKFAAIPELISEFASSTMYKFTIEKVKVMDSTKGIHSVHYMTL